MNVQELLHHLKRSDVAELALAGGYPPMVNVGGKFVPAGGAPVTPDVITECCRALGGETHLTKLSAGPIAWQSRLDGIGMIAVHAVMQGPQMQVRVQVNRQAPPPTPAPSSPAPAAAPPARQLAVPPNGFSSLDELLQAARGAHASDLHVVGDRPALLRMAGELVPAGPAIPAALVEKLVLPLVPKHLAPVLERDGSTDFSLQHASLGRFRVNVTRQRTGLKGSFRLIPSEIPSLAALGLPETLGTALQARSGLIVISGGAGQGKTTTLAALVDLLNTYTARHIVTVEDPIEFVHARKKALVSQREVGVHAKSVAGAIRSALREDPDVLMVGDLRDAEALRVAFAASESGHLVLGTLNTPGAGRTLDRLIDLFPPSDQAAARLALAGVLRLIVSQSLLTSADGSRMVLSLDVLPSNKELANLIREGKTNQLVSLQQRGKSLGIVRLDESLAEHVKANRITLDAARSAAENLDELEAFVTGKRKAASVEAPAPAPAPAAAQGSVLQKASSLFKKGT